MAVYINQAFFIYIYTSPSIPMFHLKVFPSCSGNEVITVIESLAKKIWCRSTIPALVVAEGVAGCANEYNTC